ncbi:MAG TPA: DNA mismatch endonuclease Vsr [Blastocatellia bacterium]|jgi:DNA mismatch endonuclease (patch repair protein)|nr:DNA mismatch endonuclease Vsr [Blastocatellia bacterium]
MTDVISRERRSELMSRIRGWDTEPEVAVRRGLHRAGFRFRLHHRKLPGRPDLVLARYRAVIFVHGCFWHRHRGCPLAYRPKSRTAFWNEKFRQNTARDRKQELQLLNSGWRVLLVWECGLRREPDRLKTIERIKRWLRSGSSKGEIGGRG